MLSKRNQVNGWGNDIVLHHGKIVYDTETLGRDCRLSNLSPGDHNE